MTPLPFGVTVYSGCMICSKIQIDSLSNTVVLFIDCESAVRAITRLPPCTGPPALVPELVPLELVPPQAATSVMAPAAIRASAAVVRYVTVTPGGNRRGRSGHPQENKPLFLVKMPAKDGVVNSGGTSGGNALLRCNLIRRALCGAWLRRGGWHRGRRAGAGRP